LQFSLDALADRTLINRNFKGQPATHVKSIEMAVDAERRAEESRRQTETPSPRPSPAEAGEGEHLRGLGSPHGARSVPNFASAGEAEHLPDLARPKVLAPLPLPPQWERVRVRAPLTIFIPLSTKETP
jgi:hypothetical protein